MTTSTGGLVYSIFFGLVIVIVSPVYAARCTGSASCRACTTCSSCKYCAQQGGSCGVCSSSYTPSPSTYTPESTYRSTAPSTYSQSTYQSQPQQEAINASSIEVSTPKQDDIPVPVWSRITAISASGALILAAGEEDKEVKLRGVKLHRSSIAEMNSWVGKQIMWMDSNAKSSKGEMLGYAYVTANDPTNEAPICLNIEIIKQGLAIYDGNPCSMSNLLQTAENEAKSKNRGIWAEKAKKDQDHDQE